MRAIPSVYHEAAAVDGASAWQQFRRITLPLLAPVTLFVVVITTISAYNVFTQVYVLASDVQGAPGHLVRVLVYDIFENGFRFFNMGYAAAEAMYLFLIILVLTIIQFRFLRGLEYVTQSPHRCRPDQLLAPGRGLLLAGGLMMVFPLFWLFSTSFRPAPELNIVPPRAAARDLDAQELPDGLRARRRCCSTSGTAWCSRRSPPCSSSLTSTMAGYIFAKFEFPGNNVLFMLVLATAIVPFEVYMVPLFLQMNDLKLVNTASAWSCRS